MLLFLFMSTAQYASIEYGSSCSSSDDYPSLYSRSIKVSQSNVYLYQIMPRIEATDGFSVPSFKPDEIAVYYDDAYCRNVIGYHAHGETDNNDVRIQQGTEYNFSVWESDGFSRISAVLYNVERRASMRMNTDWTFWGKMFYTNPNFNAIVNEAVVVGGDPLKPDYHMTDLISSHIDSFFDNSINELNGESTLDISSLLDNSMNVLNGESASLTPEFPTTVELTPLASIQLGRSDQRCQHTALRPGNDQGDPIGNSVTISLKGEFAGSACEILINASDGSVYTAQINLTDFETTTTNDDSFDPPIEAPLLYNGKHIGYFVYGYKYKLLDLDRKEFR